MIWAFSVVLHMTDEILNDALFFVKRHLSSSGSFWPAPGSVDTRLS
jgi:hypothetical protein